MSHHNPAVLPDWTGKAQKEMPLSSNPPGNDLRNNKDIDWLTPLVFSC
jgi:hypothetical protein